MRLRAAALYNLTSYLILFVMKTLLLPSPAYSLTHSLTHSVTHNSSTMPRCLLRTCSLCQRLNTHVRRLALSTNAIDRMVPLQSLTKLKILSLGRNQIKKIEHLDANAASLEELWMSYNQISSLDGLSSLVNLTTLYLSNNSIKAWSELDKLVSVGRLNNFTN